MKDAARLLQKTLDEEGEADKRLTAVALQLFEEAGRMATGGEEEEESPKRGRSGGRNGANAQKAGASRGKAQTGSKSVTTTDHREIQAWAEERKASPTCVRGTGKKGDQGVLRFDFPGYSGGKSLQPIEWDDFFEKFDEQGLALLYQPQTAAGERSNFNKIVAREKGGKAKKSAGARSAGATSRKR